jgi:hypothetical protein
MTAEAFHVKRQMTPPSVSRETAGDPGERLT